MAGDLKIVYAAGTMQDAHLLKNVLEEQGIRAIVTNAVLQGGSGVDILGWPTLARVAVNEENAVAAREIAVEFDRSTSSQAKATSDEAAEPLSGGAAGRRDMAVAQAALGESWPRCPGCGAPRITKCPACGTAGTGFPPADKTEEEPSEAADRLRLCIQCDEPFTPEYAHDCEWCGHEFPDGFRPPDAPEPDRLSPALITMGAITVVVVVGLLAYFAILVARFGS